MSAISADGIRVAWIAIVLLVVSLPHALEDFAFGEPARLGVPVAVAACGLLAAYVLQLIGAWLALSGNRLGYWFIAAAGSAWVIGALLVHGSEIHRAGVAWRFGATSVANVALIVLVGVLSICYGLRASLKTDQ